MGLEPGLKHVAYLGSLRRVGHLLALATLFLPPIFPQREDQAVTREPSARTPQIHMILPMGAQPGSTHDVDIRGEYLDRAERAVFSSTDITATVTDSSYSRVRMRVRVHSGAQAGPCYFRLITPRGASNLLLFRVSEWASTVETEPNDELAGPQDIDWPSLVSGHLWTARDVDLYRFRARSGDRIHLNLLAARNWSTADLSLSVIEPNGRTVIQDEGRFIWDPSIVLHCERDGDYLAAVTLTRMPAGGQSRTDLAYQLIVGSVPVLLSAYPTYLRAGSSTRVQVRGEFLNTVAEWSFDAGRVEVVNVQDAGTAVPVMQVVSTRELMVQVNPGTSPGAYFLHAKHPSGAAAPLSLLVGDLPARLESAGEGSGSSAEVIEIPVTVSGRIESGYDEDVYTFEAAAGDALVLDLDAEKLGSRLDARISLMDEAGKALASNDDPKDRGGTLNWDPRIEHTFKQGGRHSVRVASQQRRGGTDFVYSLSLRRPAPRFSLRLASERLTLPTGGRSTWNVTVRREDGFEGEVSVEVTGLPAGVQAKPLLIKPDESSGKLELEAAPDAPFSSSPVAVTGSASFRGEAHSETATVPAARVSGSGPGFAAFRSAEAWVSVIEPPLFSLESTASEVFLVRGGTAELGVRIARRTGFDHALEFSLENPPSGVTLESAEILDQGRMARLTLRSSENATAGRVPNLTIVGSARVEGRSRIESAPRISLQVD